MDCIEQSHEMAWFAQRVQESRYILSEHVIRSLMAGNIVTVADIETVLLTGRLLEEHHHATRGRSYLVVGKSRQKIFHVMCAGASNGWLIITFVYIPAPPIWRDALHRNPGGENIMTEPFSTCFFCGGEMKKITVGNFDYRLEGQLYVIKKVPAGLCQQCGEKYIEADVGRRMNDLIARKQFSRTEEVGVIDYQ
ncbi:conserved protein of unknown function [Georgfuchsia toluolica]|uniref:YgiT-type zinc finger protein n=2 Tax=Georgfuchsia toluolica TaxID=424218 RepID=A0A916J7M2_9PROT|nr:conserved protein of unknown function [Georgfuchsia toluolica]CAG4885454.1 conserved protein of unknown function [Georgfuchsia toluolica]